MDKRDKILLKKILDETSIQVYKDRAENSPVFINDATLHTSKATYYPPRDTTNTIAHELV